MKSSDIFGRVAKNKQAGYEKFKTQLQSAEISDLKKLQEFKTRINNILYTAIGLVIALSVIIGIFLPSMAGILIICSTLIIIWLFVNHFQTKAYTQSYWKELTDNATKTQS